MWPVPCAAGALPQPVACSACDAGVWIEFEPVQAVAPAGSDDAPMRVRPCKPGTLSHSLAAAGLAHSSPFPLVTSLLGAGTDVRKASGQPAMNLEMRHV